MVKNYVAKINDYSYIQSAKSEFDKVVAQCLSDGRRPAKHKLLQHVE